MSDRAVSASDRNWLGSSGGTAPSPPGEPLGAGTFDRLIKKTSKNPLDKLVRELKVITAVITGVAGWVGVISLGDIRAPTLSPWKIYGRLHIRTSAYSDVRTYGRPYADVRTYVHADVRTCGCPYMRMRMSE